MNKLSSIFCGAIALSLMAPVSTASAKPDGYYKAKAKQEVSDCLGAYDTGGSSIVAINSSVEVVSACFASGFITRVNFYTEPNCQPNQPCPLFLSKLVASVEFGCDDEIISGTCYDNLCDTNADCAADSWCRQTEFGDNECTPYVQEGDTCGGFVLPWFYEQCDPSLTCVGDPMIPDLPGVCATCNYNGTPYSAGDSFEADDGCNTCFCSDTGVVGCTKIACFQSI
jgi:hypothetical protein